MSKRIFLISLFIAILFSLATPALAEATIPLPDQTLAVPLVAPSPATVNPRYISGFGTDNAYTIFYEERSQVCGTGFRIYYNQTTTGAFGFAAASTATNVCDTHFTVNDIPITIPAPHPSAGVYAYRAWAADGNNPNHNLYVSNDLTNWVLINTFTFTDTGGILNAGENVFYGFHDVIQLNNNFIGFAETNQSRTLIVWSDDGDDNWDVVAEVGGGGIGDAPLNLRLFAGITGPTPTGRFIRMEVAGQLVYGKVSVPGDDSGLYLAVNAVAAQAATPALSEAAFINPVNWTWRDGTTGLPGGANLVLASTAGVGGHDVREVWAPTLSNPLSDWVVLYTGDYDANGGLADRAIGCAATTADCTVVSPISPTAEPANENSNNTGQPFSLPLTGFAPSIISELATQPTNIAYASTEIVLNIPSLGVRQSIVGVPQTDGTWNVDWLGNNIGYLSGTAFPTWAGNTALTGHVWNADGSPGIFHELNQLQHGDQFTIEAWGQTYTYEVRDSQQVYASNLSVLKHSDYDIVTLLTCEDFSEWNGEYRYRRAVTAVLVSVD